MTIDRVSLVSALVRSATWLFRLLSLMEIGLCHFFWITFCIEVIHILTGELVM